MGCGPRQDHDRDGAERRLTARSELGVEELKRTPWIPGQQSGCANGVPGQGGQRRGGGSPPDDVPDGDHPAVLDLEGIVEIPAHRVHLAGGQVHGGAIPAGHMGRGRRLQALLKDARDLAALGREASRLGGGGRPPGGLVRADYLTKFEVLVESYNAGSRNIDGCSRNCSP